MSAATENLAAAMARGVGKGFPYLAETLRRAGVKRNIWTLPAGQSLFLTEFGPVVMTGTPLATGMVDVPVFCEGALIRALRVDQAGESTFPEFLEASWRAGVVGYEVDFAARTVTYRGCHGEAYLESYPAID